LDGVDFLLGQAGDDILDGGTGADTMTGGDGNDTYYVDASGDNVVENSAAGGTQDVVFSSVSYSLTGRFVETLNLTGAGNINGTGNEGDQTINGNSGANTIAGLGGNDILNGGNGTIFSKGAMETIS